LQRRDRIVDSDETFRADMMRGGAGQTDPALTEAYLANQLDTYYWLQEHGVVFWHVDIGIGMNVPRCHATDPQRVLECLARSARRAGVQMHFSCPVTAVTRADPGFTVHGPDGTAFHARRGVVLATGGFSRNPQMLGRFVPGLERIRIVDGGLGNMGDGLTMAERLGAGLSSMECVKPNFYSYALREQKEERLDRFHHETPVGMVYHLGGILVTTAGRRYVREDMNAKDIARVTLGLPDVMAWGIFDETVREHAMGEKTIYINPSAMQKSLRADTLADLAQCAGLPVPEFLETVGQYNADIRAGRPDGLGRMHLTATHGKPFPIERPPFYAFPTAPNMATTFGGVRVNAHAQVLDTQGEPVEGLYACGEIVGGFHGLNFVTGTALAQAAIFARLAAKDLAAPKT
jgi:fumarate reductase flavoprotein subunit